jgi:hypothetical protein
LWLRVVVQAVAVLAAVVGQAVIVKEQGFL